MKHLSFIFLAGFVLVSTAFAPISEQILYPELAQNFKLLKKNFGSISDNRREVLLGIQQRINMFRFQKKPPVIELLSADGTFSAPVAQAVLQAALASYGIIDIKFISIPTAPNEKISSALSSLGFKMTIQDGTTAKFSEKGAPVTFASATSDPTSGHILFLEGTDVTLNAPDKFSVKIPYKNMLNGSDADYQAQAKLIATEMLWVATKIKENGNF